MNKSSQDNNRSEDLFKAQSDAVLGQHRFKGVTLHVSATAMDLERTWICRMMPQFNDLSCSIKGMSCLGEIHGNNDEVKHFQLFLLNCHLYSTFPLFASYRTIYVSLVSQKGTKVIHLVSNVT